MAKKVPVSAVLSVWSIIGIAIPLLSHAKNFLVLNWANAYFSEKWLYFEPVQKSLRKRFTV